MVLILILLGMFSGVGFLANFPFKTLAVTALFFQELTIKTDN